MNIEIKVLEWPQVDLDELATLTYACRKASPLWVEGQSKDVFKNYLLQGKERWPQSVVIAAYQNERLIGWLCLITEDQLLFEIWRWHPFISPGNDEESVAKLLFSNAVLIAGEKGAQSLEVICAFQKHQLTAQVDKYYQRQLAWYEKNGLRKSDEAAYMTCSADELMLMHSPAVPAPFMISSYHPGHKKSIFECYIQAFSSGQDQSFLEKTEEQKQTMFEGYFNEDFNSQASKVLLDNDIVKGVSLVQTRQRVGDEHLALIAVSPEFQGQGWGRKLLSASMQVGVQRGNGLFSIGVDLGNERAYNLYRSMGFEVQSKLINHIWKNGK